MSFFNFKVWVRSLFGDHEDDENNVKSYVDDAMSVVLQKDMAAVVSATQPVAASTFLVATRACKVLEAYYVPRASLTISITDRFSLLLTKRGSGTTFASGNGSATYTGTHSVTQFVAGITTHTGGITSGSHSMSGIAQNVTGGGAPNRMQIKSGNEARQLFPGDVLRVSVAPNGLGAVFPGGMIQVRLSQGEAS